MENCNRNITKAEGHPTSKLDRQKRLLERILQASEFITKNRLQQANWIVVTPKRAKQIIKDLRKSNRRLKIHQKFN